MAAPFRLALAGGLIFLFALIFGFYGFRKFLNYKIAQNVALKKGGEMRKAWTKIPLAVEFRIYIFNVTNSEEVHRGAKPVVNEIGPYFYDEWKEKVRLVDNAKEDTVSFNQRTTWYFNKEASGGLTGNETVVIPHAALLGLVLNVEREKPGALTMINKAIGPMFGNPDSIFLRATAKDILFEGIVINCTSTEFAPKAICTLLRQNPKGLTKVNEHIFKFSFFGSKNGTIDDGRLEVKRGVKDAKEVGKVVSFNGKSELDVWSGAECNALRGTDSTIFPPFLTPQDDIVSFAPDLCRSLGAKYQYPIVYQGIPGNHYTATLGDMSNNAEEKCFCPSENKCLKKGAFDITKCAGAPIILTLPHFFETDPSYLDTVDGLRPNKEEHQIYLNFEPITGTPLGARKRLQFNIEIHSVIKIPIMRNLPVSLIPLFWVEEGLELNKTFIDLLEANLFRTMRIVDTGRWVLMVVGVGLVAAGAGLNYHRRSTRTMVPKISTRTLVVGSEEHTTGYSATSPATATVAPQKY
ncbi:hypothetical protein AAG570_011561 [Ranatra chinensis]|uniref:Sensory neuron membrane protein 1 n=1 Tax=Ranatra chinensis TaxID=642074 RepID=A0ABD0YL82_9HEMI